MNQLRHFRLVPVSIYWINTSSPSLCTCIAVISIYNLAKLQT